MPSTTAKQMNYSRAQLDEIFSWVTCHGGWYNFTASSCGKCNATANVIDGEGWFCPCGSYNTLPWSGSQIPYERPTYGPEGAAIRIAANHSPTIARIYCKIFGEPNPYHVVH